MGYRLLGFAVWHGAKWFVRRRYGRLIPSRRVVAGVSVGVAVVGIALAQRREAGSG